MDISKVKKGELLEFNIYGSTVKGEFVRLDGSLIVINVTEDFIKENIGKEHTIHKSHPFCKIV